MELTKPQLEYVIGVMKKHIDKINSVAIEEKLRVKHLKKTEAIIAALEAVKSGDPVEAELDFYKKLDFDTVSFSKSGKVVGTLCHYKADPKIEV